MTSQGPRRLTRRWLFVAGTIIGVLRLLGWTLEVRGRDNVPREGGAIVVFNHHSYADFVMVGWPVVFGIGRPLRYIAKREVCVHPLIGWATRWGDVVPVDRASASARAGAFREAEDALRAGDLVAIAPEQTISPSGELLPFRTGAMRMAQATGVPVIAAVGWGSQRFWTKGGRLRRPLRVRSTIDYLEPMEIGPDDDVVAATRRLEEAVATRLHALQDEQSRGAPAGAHWVPRRLGGGLPDHDAILAAHRARTRGWGDGALGRG